MPVGRDVVLTKKLTGFLTALVCFLVALSATSLARAAGEDLIFDYAHLLSDTETADLQRYAETVSQTYGMTVSLVTTADAAGKSAMEFADDYMDDNNLFTETGAVLMLVDMDNREVYISTRGRAITLMTDRMIDEQTELMAPHLTGAAYYTACEQFFFFCESVFAKDAGQSVTGDNAPYEHEKILDIAGARRIKAIHVVVALIVGLVAAGASLLVVFQRYKRPKALNAGDYISGGSFDLKMAEDQFVSTHTTRVRISSDNNSSSGGSSSHSSGSGASHGGGGRRF